MTRKARLALLCFVIYEEAAWVECHDGPQYIPLTLQECTSLLSEGGNACIRGANVLGSKVQQAALDSYHASESRTSVKHMNMITFFFTGVGDVLVVFNNIPFSQQMS